MVWENLLFKLNCDSDRLASLEELFQIRTTCTQNLKWHTGAETGVLAAATSIWRKNSNLFEGDDRAAYVYDLLENVNRSMAQLFASHPEFKEYPR